eukprot:gnl/Chilomastix_caulleri/2679.p2 GENE.gnl/Chilomastix_caulleri/2679~~gnl/Chilomastix_caulleri/2679.p2  ORF type:complete len:72 (+),score=11.43 gnl/Chilomastix_caulleri/2679:255-470(+)
MTREFSEKVELETHKEKMGRIKISDCLKTYATVEGGKINALVTITDQSVYPKIEGNTGGKESWIQKFCWCT